MEKPVGPSAPVMQTPRSQFAELAHCRLHWESLGQGPFLLLLHSGGGGYETGFWDDGCRQLARTFRLVRYDRRGYGQSSATQHFLPGFFREECKILTEFLEAIQAPRQLSMLATSDGGTIAQLFAAEFPSRVHKLILEGTHAWFETSMGAEIRRRRKNFLLKHGVISASGSALATQQAWFRDAADPSWKPWSILEEIATIKASTLVIQGERDAFVGDHHAHTIAAAIPGARSVILPGAKHLCHISAADSYYKVVAHFLGD